MIARFVLSMLLLSVLTVTGCGPGKGTTELTEEGKLDPMDPAGVIVDHG